MTSITGKVVAITGASSAIEQPDDVEIGDITIRPTVQG
jgi:NADP-dependent 3-hydroxy acid dehydrogenase YdfG